MLAEEARGAGGVIGAAGPRAGGAPPTVTAASPSSPPAARLGKVRGSCVLRVRLHFCRVAVCGAERGFSRWGVFPGNSDAFCCFGYGSSGFSDPLRPSGKAGRGGAVVRIPRLEFLLCGAFAREVRVRCLAANNAEFYARLFWALSSGFTSALLVVALLCLVTFLLTLFVDFVRGEYL